MSLEISDASQFWMLISFVLYLLVGYYSFEVMALTARGSEKLFIHDLAEGRLAARLVWFVYVLLWPFLLVGAVIAGALKRAAPAATDREVER